MLKGVLFGTFAVLKEMLGYIGILLVLLILSHYVKTYIRFSQLGIPFKLGPPLVYRLPYLISDLVQKGTPFDNMIRQLQEVGSDMIAFKRSIVGPLSIVSANPEVNLHILKNVDKYEKGKPFMDVMRPLLGDGIFNANGVHWLNQRKMAAPMFSKREVKKMVSIFLDHFNQLKDHFKEGQAVEFQDLISRFTLGWILLFACIFLFFVQIHFVILLLEFRSTHWDTLNLDFLRLSMKHKNLCSRDLV